MLVFTTLTKNKYKSYPLLSLFSPSLWSHAIFLQKNSQKKKKRKKEVKMFFLIQKIYYFSSFQFFFLY